MTHERFSERILELAYGELEPGEARAAEAHAASCAECGAELARIRATRRAMAALPEERAPEKGERVLLAAAREAVRERRRAGMLPGWLWSASVVAALVVAVGAVSYRILAMRPAERQGEELLGRGPYAQAPSGPAPAPVPAPQQPERSANATEPATEPLRSPPPARRQRGEPTPSPERRRQVPAEPRREVARAPAASAGATAAVEEQPSPEPARHAEADPGRAAEADAAAAAAPAPDGAEDFAAPPERLLREAPAPSARAETRSRGAGAPAVARAPAPPAAAAGPEAAWARYEALRAGGALARELRTFPGCEGEGWREVERDPQGRTVRYVREGRVGGVQVRVEHLFDAGGGLAAVRATELESGAPLDAGALGLDLPRDAAEAGADAPPRCER